MFIDFSNRLSVIFPKTTNLRVGRSNRSGRAIFPKGSSARKALLRFGAGIGAIRPVVMLCRLVAPVAGNYLNRSDHLQAFEQGFAGMGQYFANGPSG